MTVESAIRINKLAAKLGLREDLVARDMLQAHLLKAMFSRTAERELTLKGGYGLRAAHGSERFTKDIDLQSGGHSPMGRIRSIMNGAIEETLKSGLLQDPVISEPKQTETVQRWKIGGRVGQSDVNLTIEVSRRGTPAVEDVVTSDYSPDEDFGVGAFKVESLSQTAIAAGKVMALLAPSRLAPRDMFDLDLLIRMEVTPPIAHLSRLGSEALKQSLQILWDKIELQTWEEASSQLIQYLPTRIAVEMDRETWETMRLSVGDTVERWLKQAIEMSEAREAAAAPAP